MPELFLQLRDEDDEYAITPAPLTEAEALALLNEASITAAKLIPWGSNYSFAVALEGSEGKEALAIYKPRSGEAPLYDFPDGTLYKREVAAYILSQRLGWKLVPPTTIRVGPHGVGSLQLYVQPVQDDSDPRQYWSACTDAIERLVLFDHIANNADRKLSHCLRDCEGNVWGIDHGLTFNEHPKLRTVLWQYVGRPIGDQLIADLRGMQEDEGDVRAALRDYLSRAELNALFARIDRFLTAGRYPVLNPSRNIPYGWF